MKTKRSFIVLAMVMLLTVALSAGFVQAQAKTVIKIASQGPLSGPQSNSGTTLRDATALAIEQLSGPLSDMGFDVQYVPYDDQATPDVGVANAQQIVNDAAILAVIGHWNSGVAIPSSVVYDQHDLVMISPANTNPQVTDRGLKVVNRVCGRDDLQGPTGADFAVGLGTVSSVYILHDTTAYGQGVATFFQTEAEAKGLTVLGFEGTTEASNFDSIITPILALSPDLIYMGGIYSQFAIFVSQVRAAGYQGTLLGPDGMDDPTFAELAGDAGVGVYYTTAAGPANVYPAAAQFITDFTAKYGHGPAPYGPQAYDATAIALLAIAQAAQDAGGAMPSRAAVAAAVRATQDYHGLTGSITFDANGDRELAAYYVLQVTASAKADWPNNTLLATLEIPSPLYAAELAAMTPEATMEATASS
jgi:branched-chain amino acid transport system substrate-binding protein